MDLWNECSWCQLGSILTDVFLETSVGKKMCRSGEEREVSRQQMKIGVLTGGVTVED